MDTENIENGVIRVKNKNLRNRELNSGLLRDRQG